jgi:hypothetical protein
MTDQIPRSRLKLARLVTGLMAALVLGGIAWYGLAPETLVRVWQNLVDRPGGPFVFRFVLQPIMAALAALRGGIRDARAGRAPFLETVLTDPAQRRGRLDEALVATSRIILLGLVIDTVYQVIEFRAFHPVEAVIIALLLAFVPYVLLRGPVTRIARRWIGDKSAGDKR